MKPRTLARMEQLLELKFQRKQSVFAKVVAEENRLRSQIRKLDDQARDADARSDHSLRAIGADVMWKAWVERKKTSMNLELAQVLAQKERLKGAVRKEYGKVLVSRELYREQKALEVKAVRERGLNTAIESHFHRKAQRLD